MFWKDYLNRVAISLTEYLKNDIQYSYIPERTIRQIAWREIELFVEDFKKWSPEMLIIKENTDISLGDQNRLNNFLIKRQKSIPLAYIIGKQKFYGLEFWVNKNVLIPRPETEELVEYVLRNIKGSSVLIDIGTGTGCILTAILKNLPKSTKLSKIFAIDKSNKVLSIAKQNIKQHLGSKFRISFINKSLLPGKLSQSKKYTIVANLPYLSEKEYQELSPEVRKYEPKSALVGGISGHELVCKLIDRVIALKLNCNLFLEISPTIYPEIKKYLDRQDILIRIKTKRDLSGKIRIMHIMQSC